MAKRNPELDEYIEVTRLGAVPVLNNKFSNSDGTPMKVQYWWTYDSDNYLEPGATIIIPKNYHVFSMEQNHETILFIFVKVAYRDGSIYHNKVFVPNSLAKIVFPIDEEGKRLLKKKTLGDVASWYIEQDTVDNAMKYLAGKTIKVCKRDVYSVRNHTFSDIRDSYIYTYEWGEEHIEEETIFSKNEVTAQYKHFSLHSIPFQESIVDVKCLDGIEYSNRLEWLSNLYLITETGYCIQCKEICKTPKFNSVFYETDDQPYEVFLDGILRMAWVYAYNAEYTETLSFIKTILNKGELTVTRDKKCNYHFEFSAYGYSWI